MKRLFDNPFLFGGTATSVGSSSGSESQANTYVTSLGLYPETVAQWAAIGMPCAYASAYSASQLNRYNELVQQLNQLEVLADNWDGYGGASFSQSALEQARKMLGAQLHSSGKVSLPNIVPTSNGTVALEWQEGDGEAVVEIGSTRVSGFIKAHNAPPVFLSGSTAAYMTSLPTLIGNCLASESPKATSISQVEFQQTGND